MDRRKEWSNGSGIDWEEDFCDYELFWFLKEIKRIGFCLWRRERRVELDGVGFRRENYDGDRKWIDMNDEGEIRDW